jgi:hypothetical protein
MALGRDVDGQRPWLQEVFSSPFLNGETPLHAYRSSKMSLPNSRIKLNVPRIQLLVSRVSFPLT